MGGMAEIFWRDYNFSMSKVAPLLLFFKKAKKFQYFLNLRRFRSVWQNAPIF